MTVSIADHSSLPSTPTSAPCRWDKVERSERPRKAWWHFLREFYTPQQLEANHAWRPSFHWQVEKRRGEISDRAIKLLLSVANQSESVCRGKGLTCETVVLFPGHVPSEHSTTDWRRTKNPRATACISSQIGCAVACPFCATGRQGLQANLSAGQIAEQVYWAGVVAKQQGHRLRNIVFMGMGEPLHNTEQVVAAIDLLTCEAAFGISARHITVSTIGVTRSMLRLASQFPRLRLALSLHSAIPDLRRQLVPKGAADLASLRAAIQRLNELQQSPVWLEVVLLKGVNDSPADAQRIVDFCEGLRVEVNLIPYNPTPTTQPFAATERPARELFAQILRNKGIRTTIRRSFGKDDYAGCGQLTGTA